MGRRLRRAAGAVRAYPMPAADGSLARVFPTGPARFQSGTEEEGPERAPPTACAGSAFKIKAPDGRGGRISDGLIMSA